MVSVQGMAMKKIGAIVGMLAVLLLLGTGCAAEHTEANGTSMYGQAVGEPLQWNEGSYAGDTGDGAGERIYGMQEMS